MEIRKARPEEIPALIEIWEAAVRATHGFLTEDDIHSIRPQVAELLPVARDLWVSLADGRPAGFMGLTPPKAGRGGEMEIDMLFIHPDRHRQGLGTGMIDFARSLCPRLKLSVNEQNPKGLVFYENRGFVVVGRSAVDSRSRKFPLLHMRLAKGGA